MSDRWFKDKTTCNAGKLSYPTVSKSCNDFLLFCDKLLKLSENRNKYGLQCSNLLLLTGTWQWGDNHCESRSVPRQIGRVRVFGAHGPGDHSHSRCLHWQDYDSVFGKKEIGKIQMEFRKKLLQFNLNLFSVQVILVFYFNIIISLYFVNILFKLWENNFF